MFYPDQMDWKGSDWLLNNLEFLTEFDLKKKCNFGHSFRCTAIDFYLNICVNVESVQYIEWPYPTHRLIQKILPWFEWYVAANSRFAFEVVWFWKSLSALVICES